MIALFFLGLFLLFIFFFFIGIPMAICHKWALETNRDPGKWAFIGMCLGWLGVAIMMFVKNHKKGVSGL